jgi:hypothetical protein
MKRISMLVIAGVAIAAATFYSCQKEAKNSSETLEFPGKKPPPQPPSSSCMDYNVSLSRSYDGVQTTFIWSITNPRPGNGKDGTLQNLSHWTFIPGCAGDQGLEQNWSDITGAEYSTDGQTWNVIDPTPTLQPDPSQTCSSANVFKFDQGTTGAATTYYKLTVLGNYGTEKNTAVFKSGANTGCCTREVDGIGCKTEDICSYSQGYYFAKPGPTWTGAGTVSIGGFTYTEAEGRAIWNCSNAGGIPDSKKGFTQVAALKLSGIYPTGNAGIDADVVTIETWLSSLGKLVACSNLPTGNSAVGGAAGRIGDWINENHCTTD